VIVGAGMAGASAAETLRREGYTGWLVLLGAEPLPPYERPPLSKGYLLRLTPEEKLFARPAAWYAEQGVELRLGARAVALDAQGGAVELASGERVGFDRLLIATGSEPRRLEVPGADLAGIVYLRTLADAQVLLREFAGARAGARIVVVGAGFIGAEVAAVARALGLGVTMIEPLAAPVERALGREVGALLAREHRAQGVDLRLGEGVVAFGGGAVGGGRRVSEVVTTSGARIPCEFVVVGVGVRPATEWLRGSGLALDDGVVVDRFCATSVSGVYAAGDIARWPYQPAGAEAPTMVRLEHFDNALRQGETAARNMLRDTTGQARPYAPIPYFWSDQYDLQLQMVGHASGEDGLIVRGSLEARSLVAFYLGRSQKAPTNGETAQPPRIRAILLVNRVRELGPARKLVAAGAALDLAQLADETLDLRRLIPPVP
jgi:3-phenylpropionate/trans-cinnamate dioxygenase ferredoxin reductase subunit